MTFPTLAQRSSRRLLALLALCGFVAACGGGGNQFPDPPPTSTDTQSGTTTPTTEPPGPVAPTPPTTPQNGPDTQAPSVSMVLPKANDNLSGTAAIQADASDNVGVANVQFLVDGKSLGAADTTTPFWLQFDTSYLSDGTHAFSARATDAAGNQTTATARNATVSNTCKTASPALTPWQNSPLGSVGTSFRVEFDATPLEANMNAALGLARGDAGAFSDLAAFVRFNTNNIIDVRNGNVFSTLVNIPYAPNQTFHVRMDVNVGTRTYTVFVTPPGGAETLLALNALFATNQNSVTSLDRWVVGADQGALKVCNMSLAGNTAPVARAGADQTVTTGARVVLDGSGSSDSNGSIVSYAWRQTAGSAVTLSGANAAVASFTAPSVSRATTLTFELTVTDNQGASATDSVSITVNSATPANQPPTASAGADTAVTEGTGVILSGSGTDSDGSVVSFAWTQTAGPTVTLAGANTSIASFTAPQVTANTTLTFRLVVTDNSGATGSDVVNVTVRNSAGVNAPPVANAGADRTVSENALVSVSGGGTDIDGTIVSYAWTLLSGPSVTLFGANTSSVSFIAPSVFTPITMTFQLTVTDNGGATGSDTVNVTVNNVM